jgi:hypothetical protein
LHLIASEPNIPTLSNVVKLVQPSSNPSALAFAVFARASLIARSYSKMLAHLLLRLETLELDLGGVDAASVGSRISTCLLGGGLHNACLRATTDLDREELRHEGGDRDRLGVKSGGERMAVGPGGAVLIPPGVRITIVILMVDPSWRFRLDDLSYWHVDSFGRDGGRDSPCNIPPFPVQLQQRWVQRKTPEGPIIHRASDVCVFQSREAPG